MSLDIQHPVNIPYRCIVNAHMRKSTSKRKPQTHAACVAGPSILHAKDSAPSYLQVSPTCAVRRLPCFDALSQGLLHWLPGHAGSMDSGHLAARVWQKRACVTRVRCRWWQAVTYVGATGSSVVQWISCFWEALAPSCWNKGMGDATVLALPRARLLTVDTHSGTACCPMLHVGPTSACWRRECY